jgi:hypothetical protein
MAAITPGIHPQQVRMMTRRIAPQPRSSTASGGNMIHRIALKIPICSLLFYKLGITVIPGEILKTFRNIQHLIHPDKVVMHFF